MGVSNVGGVSGVVTEVGVGTGVGRRRFDVVLMDNMMPVMSGVEACREMRRLGYRGHIFGLTGHALAEDVKAFTSAGANHIFKKPVNVKELIGYLGRLNDKEEEEVNLHHR